MSNKDLKRDPQSKSGEPGWWWYERARGVCIVVEPDPQTQTVTIPWARIRAAVRRKDKKP